MSTQNEKSKKEARPPAGPESQADRWLKYGSNVVLAVVLVIFLVVIAIWLADRAEVHANMTGVSQRLTPQSIAVVKGLKEPVTLVSLYHAGHDEGAGEADRAEKERAQRERAKAVSDLLDEYKSAGDKVEVMEVDPINEKQKLELLHQDFIKRYGNQIKSYEDYLKDWRTQFDKIKQLTDAEAKLVAKFASAEPSPGEDESPIAGFVSTVTDRVPDQLVAARKAVDHELKKKHPDYKGAAAAAREQTTVLSQLAAAVIGQAPQIARATNLPPDFKKYVADSLPRYQNIKKIADDLNAKGGALKELKVDQLEAALNVVDPILVLGADNWRILSPTQVWQEDNDTRAINSKGKVTPRFAGEQQITAAIYSLQNPKQQKICFVRGGGGPLTAKGFPPFIPGGPFSGIAERLREYNFEVLEKDLSGTWAMQAQMRQQRAEPEPSDEEIKDAIWIVFDIPMGEQQQRMGPPALGPKLKEHLAQGGSALVLAIEGSDDLADALKDWGIQLYPKAIAVHEVVKLSEAEATDPLEEAKSRAFIWDCRNYGDHMLAAPITNLDSALIAPIVVRTIAPAAGYTVTPFLPLSANMPGLQTWGETNLEDLFGEKDTAEYNPNLGDLAGPVFTGAISEKNGGGRVVVIGSLRTFHNINLRIADPRLAKRDPPIRVNRFPGNVELFSNSVFWLAHLEPLIAISPAAMDVSRINVTDRSRMMWGLTILLFLPAAAIASGIGVYFKRRD